MEDEAVQKVKERLQELPKDVQEAILASDFEERIAKIGQANRLHIDQIGELGDETMLVMLGFESAEGFSRRIQQKLHLYDEQASLIATAINNDIFLPIRESMKEFQRKKQHPDADIVPAAATTPPPPVVTPSISSPATALSATGPEVATPMPTTTEKQPEIPKKEPVVSPADMMLSQKVVSIPAQTPPVSATPAATAPKVGNSYKTDPYREPVE